jgi:energy-converting hydrogenase Eha subunit A
MSELILAVLVLTTCVYGTSSAAKLGSRRNYTAFRVGLAETSLVPQRLLRAVAAMLTGVEAAVAAGAAVAAILIGTGLRGARPAAMAVLACAIVLTGALAAGVAVVIRTGTHATCACFGARPGQAGRALGWPHLVRNLALLIVLLTGLAASAAVAVTRPAPAPALVAAATGAVIALLAIMLDDIVALFAPLERQTTR